MSAEIIPFRRKPVRTLEPVTVKSEKSKVLLRLEEIATNLGIDLEALYRTTGGKT